jgi:starch-binding outer membrane protein, SusD/RagB family
MKKIFLFFVSCLFLFGSCDQEFLEEFPPQSITRGNFYQTEAQLIMASNAVQNQLYTVWGPQGLPYLFGDAYGGDSYIYLAPGTAGDWFDLANHMNVFPGNGIIGSTWNGYYSGIFRVNDFLEELEASAGVFKTPGLQNRLKAEALFVRASFYYYLAYCFGDVPLVTTVLGPARALEAVRNPESAVIAQVEQDLQFAIANLPASYPASEAGRVTSHVARAMLSRVYMSYGKTAEARPLLEAIINSGQFSLDSNKDGVVDYRDYRYTFNAYTKNSPESLMELQFISGVGGLSHGYVSSYTPFLPAFRIPGTTVAYPVWGLGAVEQRLYDAFEPNDTTRRAVTAVMFVPDPAGGAPVFLPHTAKYYLGFREPANLGSNIPIIRYPEILLNYAEVTNNPQYLNMVRARYGLPGFGQPGYPSNITTLAQALEHERRVEFAFEFQRGFDLRRTGRFLQVKSQEAGRQLEQWRLLFPIPQSVRDVNKGITQNAGYN